MQAIVKKWGAHVGAILIFLALTVVYFSPAILDGKVMRQSDMDKVAGMGTSQMKQYQETAAPGDWNVWSDAMFGGMPYIVGYGDPASSLPKLELIEKPVKGISYLYGGMVFAGLVCFYILMCVLGVNWWLAVAGAIAFAFASYNLIIIEAGHITKAYVIAYMPSTLAGMALLFRNRYLWGSLLFLLGVALSISNGHIQITYYLVLLCLFIYAGYLVMKVKEKNFKELGLVTGIMAVAVLLAILPNAQKMYADWDLGKHSTRGPTELTTMTAEGEKISSGLDRDYAFQWSYGRTELLTLLIPNAYGGGSIGTVDGNSELAIQMRNQGYQSGKEIQTYTYWGDKPGTSGPVYIGAIICFLFVFGMFVIRSSMKWWLFAGSVFLTILALGWNLAFINDFIFHYLPLYNKFRTVEMALVIPGLVFPLIAIWGVNDLFREKVDDKTFKKGWIGALAITGGLCLIVWLMPRTLLDFQSAYDAYRGLPDWYISALALDRASLASADAFRSLVFILLSAALLFVFFKSKNRTKLLPYIGAGLLILILADLWGIDKRYVNDGSFDRRKPEELYQPTVADQEILKDKDSYRVLTLNNPFQETDVSYFHHSVGGYHAAKLRRYQELIDHCLFKEINGITAGLQNAQSIEDLYSALAASPSLNMLNTRYIIYNPEYPPITNPFAFGNAWFVKHVQIVENADAEIESLNRLDPLEEAVTDKRFAGYLDGLNYTVDSTAVIALTNYRPNRLTYTSQTASEQFAVFSEIYYQSGWQAYIDGTPVEHIRVDWTLRGLRVPAGTHEIVFEFKPKGYITASYVTAYSSFLILLLVIGAIGYSGWRFYNKEE